jgi:serine/threonine-protein kinase
MSDVKLAGRYRLAEAIGRGGMGEVWRAEDELLGRTVAVKLVLPELRTDEGFARRFLAEARAMASVDHPGVVTIHDFHADAQGAYL